MIYKINENNPPSTKMSLLNDMILELAGKIAQSNFSLNEIDKIYSDIDTISRAYNRNIVLGNTYATFSNWTHVYAQSGYSIWKIAPTGYVYSLLNKLYFDDKEVENRGEADSETLTSFDKVFLYDGSFTDNTTEAASEGGTPFSLISEAGEYLYIGSASQFGGVTFEFAQRGSGYEILGEYWDGSGWTPLEFSGNEITDDTNNFQSDGNYTFDVPNDWATTSVNSQSKYWVRFSHDGSSIPVTVATANLIVPSNSVVGLLTLSSDEFFKEQWAFASYGSYIYVTIRNNGLSAYEGNYFITSSSSTINKQNFFISNHSFKADYLNSTYSSSTNYDFVTGDAVTVGDLVYVSGEDTFGLADASVTTKKAVAVCTNVTDGEISIVNSRRVNNVNTEGNGDIVAGQLLFLSTTAGKVTNTSDQLGIMVIQEIGIAITDESSDNKVDILVNINYNPTELESGA